MNEYPYPPDNYWEITDNIRKCYKDLVILPTRDKETGQLGWQVHSKIQPGGNKKWFDYVEGEIDLEEMKILINMELL